MCLGNSRRDLIYQISVQSQDVMNHVPTITIYPIFHFEVIK